MQSRLQRPLPNDLLRIVATGKKSDSTIVNGWLFGHVPLAHRPSRAEK
jgi:hypothetical protein